MMIKKISQKNIQKYYDLSQIYEEEFSPLTGATKNDAGLYPISTEINIFNIGFFIYQNKKIVGFIVINIQKEPFDVCEFFILKEYRKKGLGKKLAYETFNKFKGQWTVKQLEGALESTKFWQKIITEYTNDNFSQTLYEDKKWGKVHTQSFSSI